MFAVLLLVMIVLSIMGLDNDFFPQLTIAFIISATVLVRMLILKRRGFYDLLDEESQWRCAVRHTYRIVMFQLVCFPLLFLIPNTLRWSLLINLHVIGFVLAQITLELVFRKELLETQPSARLDRGNG
ncbi:MAG: hypothetical protein R2688_05405 [Fimbriimonadaceae bacterium]